MKQFHRLCILEKGWQWILLGLMATGGLLQSLKAAEPVHLVNHTNLWHYREGTSEPTNTWTSLPDAELDASWMLGPGGFGMGDNDDATVLDMENNFLTVYTRQTFTVTHTLDTNLNLRLVMDWDDGFVAYLDGVEVARSDNVPGTPGIPHPFDAGVSPDHDASADGGAIEVFDLGPLGDRLPLGEHILAVQGINGDIESSDVSLIADLFLEDVPTNQLGGTLTNSTVWSSNMNPILVTSDIIVPEGITLTITEGVEIRVGNGAEISADGGAIDIQGTVDARVYIRSDNPGNWGGINATGTNSSLTIRYADITQGPVEFLEDTVGLMEDSHVHNYYNDTAPIVRSLRAELVTVRRCHIAFYHETLFRIGLTIIEDCLFENATNPSSDALDFDSVPPGSTIRRCTFRNGLQTNTDAIDIGPTAGISAVGVIIEDCIMHDFTDKGVSIGEESFEIIVRNCLIYNTGSGIQVKDISTAGIHNCTIVDSGIGLHGFEKTAGTGGGQLTNTFNNILAGNADPIAIEDDTFIIVGYSDIFGETWGGIGNINADPLFLNPAQRDYRLSPSSPCIGTGLNGADMGVSYPLGGIPDVPGNIMIDSFSGGVAMISWDDTSINEDAFEVEMSQNGVEWTVVATEPRDGTSTAVSGLNDSENYLFRIRAVNFIGNSFYSIIISTGGIPDDLDGDGLPNDWETANGLDLANPADALIDQDNDGSNSLEEYQAGTDPTDPESVLRFEIVQLTDPQTVRLVFVAQSNKTYSIEYKTNLGDPTWSNLLDVPGFPSRRPFFMNDPIAPGTPSRFYRLVTPSQP